MWYFNTKMGNQTDKARQYDFQSTMRVTCAPGSHDGHEYQEQKVYY